MRHWTYSLVIIFEVCLIQSQASLPPCFEEGLTWYADDVLDLTVDAETVYDCQADCEENVDCVAFTWNTPSHTHYPMLCTMFHTTSRQELCSGCISGPDSCTCSAEYGCDITGDNMVDTVPGVDTELECMGLCYQERECEMYTWFDEGNVYRHFCFLFKYCQSYDFDCNGCFSGPPVCGPQPTDGPTDAPTDWWPTDAPTDAPTHDWPTEAPTEAPTHDWPTEAPTEAPTHDWPTEAPTEAPTHDWPTEDPTEAPTHDWPTEAPTEAPTHDWPTEAPTEAPTHDWPSEAPTEAPTDW